MTNHEVLVSVLIPTYKGQHSLRKAICSALNQTHSSIEVIVVDDNDPLSAHRYETEAIIDEFNDARLTYIKHSENRNGSAARNTAFRFSTGNYVGFLDDDDEYVHNKIEKQVEYLLSHNEFDGVYCWRYQNRKIIKSDLTGDLSKALLSLDFTPYTSSLLIKRQCYSSLNGFDESYKRLQDFEFLLRYFDSYALGVVEEPLVYIKNNEVDNRLHGMALEKQKITFLEQFTSSIDKYSSNKNKFRETVYAKHFAPVFWDYLKSKDIKNSSRIFRVYSEKCGIMFSKHVLQYLINHIKMRLSL